MCQYNNIKVSLHQYLKGKKNTNWLPKKEKTLLNKQKGLNKQKKKKEITKPKKVSAIATVPCDTVATVQNYLKKKRQNG